MHIESNIQAYRSLAEVFTNANIKRVIKDNDFSRIKNRLKKYVAEINGHSYGEVLKEVADELYRNYRVEMFYKNKLFHEKLIRKYGLKETVSFTEFTIKKSIADYVLINGELQVYEIKTEWDSLSKVLKQVEDYKSFADRIYIVSHQKHLSDLLKEYQNTAVGIIELKATGELTPIKEANRNRPYDIEAQFKTLRKPEYSELIGQYYGSIPEVSNMYFFRECLRLAKKMPFNYFRSAYLDLLKKRSIRTTYEKDLQADILQSICYHLSFSEQDYRKLKKFLKKTIH